MFMNAMRRAGAAVPRFARTRAVGARPPKIVPVGAGPFDRRGYLMLMVSTLNDNGMPVDAEVDGVRKKVRCFVPHQASMAHGGLDRLGAHSPASARLQSPRNITLHMPSGSVIEMPWLDVRGPMALIEGSGRWDDARMDAFRRAGGGVYDLGDLGERAYADRLRFAVDWLRGHRDYHMLSSDANCMAYVRDEIKFLVGQGHVDADDSEAFAQFLALDVSVLSGESFREALVNCGLRNTSAGTSSMAEDTRFRAERAALRQTLQDLEHEIRAGHRSHCAPRADEAEEPPCPNTIVA